MGELIRIVDVYPGLEDEQLTKQAIRKLIALDWLVVLSPSFEFPVVKAAPDLQTKIATRIQNPHLS